MFPLQVAIEPIINWGEVAAAAINSVGVLLAVQGIKYVLPIIRQKWPWAIPIIAMLGGIGIGALTNYLFELIGYPVDLSAIESALTGAGAVALNQIGKQVSRGG